jgi:hypothetical protein
MSENTMKVDGQSYVAVRTDSGNGEAWHKLGSFEGAQSAIEASDKFKGGIPVFEKEATFVKIDGQFVPTENFAIVRLPMKHDPEIKIIGDGLSERYNIVQPTEIFQAFDERVKQPIETLGFIGDGEKAFVTWAMPRSIIVAGVDEVKLFGTILAGFNGKVSLSLSLIAFRTLCENTFNAAMEILRTTKSDGKSQGRVWVGHHNSPNILRDLGAWMGHVQKNAEEQVVLAENLFGKLASTPVDDKNVLKSLIEACYPAPEPIGFFPDELRSEKQEKIDDMIAKAEADRVAIEGLFNGGDKTTKSNNLWDLFNNTTYYENHVRLSKKDTANSIVFGARASQMNDNVLVLANYAETKEIAPAKYLKVSKK